MDQKLKIVVLCGILLLVSLIAYEPMRHNGFVDYDDVDYITENTLVLNGLTVEGLTWSFTETDLTANWHPLTWLSHMLDVQLFGVNPLGHHLVSLLLHLANALLLFWIFNRTTGALWPSFFIAAVFALHPLRVESVAWAAERKDVLSGFFWMLTIAAHVLYTEKPALHRYLWVVIFFILGLMAKPMLVTLPFVLLLLDVWPLKRIALKRPFQRRLFMRLLVEKIPLFVLTTASCVMTFMIQRQAGAMLRGQNYSLMTRLSNAAVAYVGYIGKLFYPVKLAVLYPHPGTTLPIWQPIAAVGALVILTTAALFWGTRKRYLLVGWLWYLGTLVPVIGLVQVGSQAMADRYTYLPAIGLCVMLAWGVADLLGNRGGYRLKAVGVAAAVILAALTLGTRHQVSLWKDTLTLYEHTLAVTENNYVVHGNYGNALQQRGKPDEAIEQLKKALQLKPDYTGAMINLGMAFRDKGRIEEAMAQWQGVLALDPAQPNANANIALTLALQGRYNEAIPYLNTVLKTNPDFPDVRFLLAEIYSRTGNPEKAAEHFVLAVKSRPDDTAALNGLAIAYLQLGRLDQAVERLKEVLLLDPNSSRAHINLAFAMTQMGQYNAAIEHYNAVLVLEPDRPDILSQLAASYAALGDFHRAISVTEKALVVAKNGGNDEVVGQIQKQLDDYKSQLNIQ